MAFRREKYIAYGGPNGGDGGNGGNVILIADENINTLAELNTQKTYRAEDGENGKGSNMTGKRGEDMIIKVPVGTIIFTSDKKELIEDLAHHGNSIVIAKGGKGGLGNQHFATSTHQTPRFAETGEPGEGKEILLELKLVADIGLIGQPNAGKSTLISRISAARPKIAPYPFTTIIPNLGVVNMRGFGGEGSFVVADIPGLIEGAHHGKGLGHEFLRHVSRTHILVHLIDVYTGEIDKNFKIINEELSLFDKKLAKKPQLVALNKIDLISEEEAKKLKSAFIKKHAKYRGKTFLISGVSGAGIKELIFKMWETLQKTVKKEKLRKKPAKEAPKIFRPGIEKILEIIYVGKTHKKKIFELKGARIEQMAIMTDFNNIEGVRRLFHYMEKSGIYKALRKEGAVEGDQIKIGEKYLTFPEL